MNTRRPPRSRPARTVAAAAGPASNDGPRAGVRAKPPATSAAAARPSAKRTPAARDPQTATPATARSAGSPLAKGPAVLISSDGERFEIVQVVGKALGMRAGKVRTRGKTTGRSFATIALAMSAARARVAELRASGYTPATLAQIS